MITAVARPGSQAKKSTIREIAPSRLIVDPDVQRGLDRARVDRMAASFDIDGVGVLVVSDRDDGTLHVADGQHRRELLISVGLGDEPVACQVYKGLTRAEEAALFRVLNNNKQVPPIDKFRIRVVEGEPMAVQINTALHAHGWTVKAYRTDGTFMAVSAIESVYKASNKGSKVPNAGLVETLISVITAAWGHNADGVRAEAISGIGAVLMRHHDAIDLAKLVSVLAGFPGGPLALIGNGRGLRDLRGGRIADSMAEIIVELYNGRRRLNRLPDWRAA
jgi:hypothetical protein